MYHNEIYTDVNEALPLLLRKLEKDGHEVGSRAGRTRELTHIGITLDKPLNREILLEHRKPSIAAQIAETVWVLSGGDDIGWLSHYLPRAADFSDDGDRWRAAYGARLRSWRKRDGSGDVVDQLRYVVEHLQQSPGSRQAVMSIWDPVIDTSPGKDIPCNDWLHFISRHGQLDLHVSIRSNDIVWGWSGVNQFEWSVLLEVVAGLVGLNVGALHFSTTSLHIYEHHWVKGHRIFEHAYSTVPRMPAAPSPRFDAELVGHNLDNLDTLLQQWFHAEKVIRHGEDADELVESFTEPMLQSWLRVLQWWWTGDRDYLQPLEGTALEQATLFSVQPPARELPSEPEVVEIFSGQSALPVDRKVVRPSRFIEELCRLHTAKHEAYGDSWKRRGEMLGILANIARKIDRLSGGETADETSADTAGDLFVYLAKYRTWLTDRGIGPGPIVNYAPDRPDLSDTPEVANQVMREVEERRIMQPWPQGTTKQLAFQVEWLTKTFDRLEEAVTCEDHLRHEIVDDMLEESYVLARVLWEKEQAGGYRGADVD